jgi:4-amino-4-deoxy-L-arabinose transferase-like glycosyltransferase
MRNWLKKTVDFHPLLPYGMILLWIVPLLLLTGGEQSLVAHDEGIYGNRARLMLDTGNWIHPWASPHFKTPGPYWLLAISFSLFGINETAARLPSILASILSAVLFYQIAKMLLNSRSALLATLSLWVSFLWLQYSRFATPDLPFISLVLLAIWAFLKAERSEMHRSHWQFLAGFSLGFSFLIRSFMLALPCAALLPYWIGNHRRHHHLTSISLYLGFMVGFSPTLIWIALCWPRFGMGIVNGLFGFVLHLGSDRREGHGLFYYGWNLLLNGFPWVFFSFVGFWQIFKQKIFSEQRFLLVGFPIVLFILLSSFATRIPHYALLMYPSLALLAGVGLDALSQPLEQQGRSRQKWILSINIILLMLGLVLGLAGLAIQLQLIKLSDVEQLRQYGAIGLVLGIGWTASSTLWLFHPPSREKSGFASGFVSSWIAGLLMSSWLALATAGVTGLLGNANPELKAFIAQPQIRQVLETQVIDFASLQGKMGVLLRFYTPHIGKQVGSLEALPRPGYAWVRVEQLKELDQLGWKYQSLGDLRDWYLIQLPCSPPVKNHHG